MDEEEFKTEYANKLATMIDDCMWGEDGNQAIIIFSNAKHSMVHVYSVNATADDAEQMVMSAASFYVENSKTEGRVFH
jgi:hypothetical protein